MKLAAFLMFLLTSTAIAAEHLSLGGATPGLTRKQLESTVHGPLHCKQPDRPLKPVDANDVDCLRRADLAHSGFFSGSSPNHPITFVYRFRHGQLGAIFALGLKPEEYAALLSGLVAKFSTPDKVEKPLADKATGAPPDNQWDGWTDGNNVLELRRVATRHAGAGLRLTAKWYRDELGKSGDLQSADGS
ncbi:MAG: hypothetical protein P4L92_20110 [Rudaea sp.]|nr:hypothetical protein [Rudaea sp.]